MWPFPYHSPPSSVFLHISYTSMMALRKLCKNSLKRQKNQFLTPNLLLHLWIWRSEVPIRRYWCLLQTVCGLSLWDYDHFAATFFNHLSASWGWFSPSCGSSYQVEPRPNGQAWGWFRCNESYVIEDGGRSGNFLRILGRCKVSTLILGSSKPWSIKIDAALKANSEALPQAQVSIAVLETAPHLVLFFIKSACLKFARTIVTAICIPSSHMECLLSGSQTHLELAMMIS